MKFAITPSNRVPIRSASVMTALTFTLFACASGPDVWTDYDRSVNFSQYKTFSMMGHEGHGNLAQNYSSLTDQRINQAIRNQMLLKGFTESADPQLLVNYTVTVEDKQKVTTTTVPTTYVGVGYPYGYYRAGFYAPWPNYATQTQVRNYKQGTLVIDIVDSKRKLMVWEGTAQGTVTEKKLNNLDQAIDSAVAATLASFPPGVSTTN